MEVLIPAPPCSAALQSQTRFQVSDNGFPTIKLEEKASFSLKSDYAF
jgi:hypothetical protein